MLYKITTDEHGSKGLEPLPFDDFSALGQVEKDLEVLLATHLLDVLFEDAALMPVFQERAMQAEADLYAINREGDLIIFELKRGLAGHEAMLQALRYGQDAGQWTYSKLEGKYRAYCGNVSASLSEAHREAFNLDKPLTQSEFNKRQEFIIVGSAANDSLIAAVDYWKRQGLAVDFLPYRVYSIAGQYYFEFFARPYDRHQNPSSVKGVLFDTNRSWDQDAVWAMIERGRVAAYGDAKHVVDYLNTRDIVFFSHRGVGVVAAAEVTGPARDDGAHERYRDVRFVTPVPRMEVGITKFMPFGQVSDVTGKNFYWARTVKVPYLTRDEALMLLAELRRVLS